jgi:hypothetical protein
MTTTEPVETDLSTVSLTVGDRGVSDVRTVSVRVEGDPITFNTSTVGRDLRTFRPEKLRIEWREGRLHSAYIEGPRLKKDGEPYVTGERERLGLAQWPSGSQTSAVEVNSWVSQPIRAIIDQYAPVASAVTS